MNYNFNHKTLQFTPSKFNWKPYVLIAFMCASLGFTSAVKFNTFIEKIPVIIRLHEEECNEINLRALIKKMNLRFEDVIVAQYKLESTSGTSQVFKENHNLFGMKVAKLRPTTALGENLNHAYYKNWQDCVVDYAFWQIQNAKNIDNESEYLQLLDGMYAEGDNYSKKLKQIK